MKGKRYLLRLVFILSAVIVGGCVPFTDRSTEVTTDTPTGEAGEVPEGVQDALDAVLAYLGEEYSEQAPAPSLTWTGASTFPEDPPPGGGEYRFTAEGWVITIDYAILPPEWTTYQVAVTNQAVGFEWQGTVDATGQVVERLAPEEVVAARAAALSYIRQHYGTQVEPELGLVWVEENITPEGLVGGTNFEFTTGDWVVTISYPVVAPEDVVYHIVVTNQATGFQWEGEVDAAGQVTELSASTEPGVQVPDPGCALDVALA